MIWDILRIVSFNPFYYIEWNFNKLFYSNSCNVTNLFDIKRSFTFEYDFHKWWKPVESYHFNWGISPLWDIFIVMKCKTISQEHVERTTLQKWLKIMCNTKPIFLNPCRAMHLLLLPINDGFRRRITLKYGMIYDY